MGRSDGPAQGQLEIGRGGIPGIDQIPPGPWAEGLDGLWLLPQTRSACFLPAADDSFQLGIRGGPCGPCCHPRIGAINGGAEGKARFMGELGC